ncbi:MAG TPA: PAS domain-containing sensor histidine kinase [Polyangiaceae bacterium]|jgi:hypothetical protein|nr:PAS domain-containing sensor histidine kinase [Polyangiaceae bacterium]
MAQSPLADRLQWAGSERPSDIPDDAFRLLVESVRDYAIFMLDPTGHIATWNAGAERIKGYRAAEIVGKHFSVFYPPDVVASGKCELELAIATEQGRFEEEGLRIRKDGSPFWANVTITALRDAQQRLVGFAKVTRDLSERRAAEEETRRFRLLVESVKDYAIFILDTSGHVATWNAGAERIKGYRALEIIGKHFSVFYPPDAVAAGICETELTVAEATGRFAAEGTRVRKDGSEFWASVTITALRDPNGELIGFAKVTRDLTDRLAAEESRRDLAVQMAALAEKARIQEFQERFLGILGHDLRNPLASMDMGAALLRQRTEDANSLRIIDRIQTSSLRMSRMIEQIIELTRSRLGGGLPINARPVDLEQVLLSMVEELRAAYPEQAIELSCEPTTGHWDPDRLEQVFSNLVSNALAHGDPTKPVSIRLRREEGAVIVEIHNHGVPLTEELKARIFDPFRRGDRDSRTQRTAGLGLGLYISNELVRAHGGRMEVESSTAEGTVFRVILPPEAPASALAEAPIA